MLLKKANTITTPTAYSNGFLHSVKPEVVENLLLQSNQFDTTWVTTNSSVTSGQSGYDGSSDAWLLQNSSNSGFVNQNVSNSGVSVFSVYAKAGNVNFVRVRADYASIATTYFDLANGVVGTESNVIDSKITSVGNGWYRCSIIYNGTTTKVRVYPAVSDGDTTGTNNSIYIQDAQLNKGLTAYPYLETTTEAKPSADFTFTRNSSATRVNELGYIEDVQIIGGELVSNGDFEEIGSELVVNGSFDTDSDWVYGTGWSIANGKASCDGSQTTISNIRTSVNLALGTGKIFRLTFEVKDYVSGQINNVTLLNTGGAEASNINANGIYTVYSYGPSGGDGILQFQANSDFIGSIDNVSVKEVGQDWTFGTGWSITDDGGNQKATRESLAIDSNLQYSPILVNGNKYRISFDVSDLTIGNIGVRIGNTNLNDLVADENKSYSFDTIADGSNIIFRGRNYFDGSIDNISVKEVTDDTNLPRINYEGFTYAESLGDNLLSDPVNLVTDFLTNSGGVIVDSNTFTTSGGSLDGIKKTFLTIGKRYKLVIEGSTTSSGFTIGNLSVSGNEYGSGFGTHYFTAANTGLWIRQTTAGTTDITSFKVQEFIGDLPVPYSGKGHLLLEGQRSNLITYSEDYSQWTDNSSTRISNAAISPSGLQDAYKLESLVGTSYGTNRSFTSSAANHTCSVYAKASGFNYVKLIWSSGISSDFAVFNLTDGLVEGGTYISANIEDAGNGWYRCSMTSSLTGGGVHYVWISDGTINRSSSVTGDGTSGIYVWGSMVEVGDYVSSYIPTNGTAVTRLGETCNNAGNADLFDSEGVLYAECSFLTEATYSDQISLGISDGSISNRIIFYVAANSTDISVLVQDSGVTSIQEIHSLTLEEIAQFNNFAIRYKDNDFSFWVNGVQVVTDTSGNVPTNLNQLVFDRGDGVRPFYGKTKMVATFPYLSNDEMECLTGEGYGTFEALAAAYSYTIK